MKKTTQTQNLKNSNTLFKNVIQKKSCPELVSGLFQGLAHGKTSRQVPKDNRKLTKDIKISNTRKKGETIHVSEN